ncbi:MAG TPA: amino acid deaminase/aldolase [Blastocatellia bacterium]|nr:amino acid deaminase/aldolase [Blastocatellia bacterium]
MPFAFVDLDALAVNVGQVLSAGNKLIRIASKSVRSVAILKRIMAYSGEIGPGAPASSGARFQGLLCFTAPEAVYLSGHGFDDLVVAYPTWNSRHISAVARAAQEGGHITLMADSLAHIEQIEAIAKQCDARIPICLDIDMASDWPGLHFGVWRSMVRTGDAAGALAKRIANSKHLLLDGVMGYEAQIAGLGDHNPGERVKNAATRWLKRRSVNEVANRRAEVVHAIEALGCKLRFVNGGGTGSIATTSSEAVVTEVTVGSAFYAPALFDRYRDFRYSPAAGYAIEIVRQPRPDLYTCLGGGYVASGIGDPSRLPAPWLPEGAALLPLEGAGEVQTPIRYQGPEKIQLGDPVFMRHSKAGELCEHFTNLLLVSGGGIVDQVTTYRGDGQCFL